MGGLPRGRTDPRGLIPPAVPVTMEVEVFAPLTVIMHADGGVEIAEWRNCSRR
jgi:hypothetical protein